MTDHIFDHSIGIILDIKIWSGSKNLKPEDFTGIELPPEDLVSLGSKRIHNKDTLRPIQAVRTRAVTFMESNGVSLYGGKIWLVPADKLGEVQSLLSDFAAMFETEKNNFLADFYGTQQQWLDQNKKWAGILEPYLDTPETVEKKFGFTWRTFRIGAAQADDTLAETVTGDMTCALLKEVSTLASEAYQTLKDKDRATPKNLNRLDRLGIKLKGLAFVNPGVGIIQQELSQILEARDAHGAMTGQDVFCLSRLLVQLKNPAVLGEILDAQNGDSYQFVYEDEAPVMPPPVFTNPKNQTRLPEAWF